MGSFYFVFQSFCKIKFASFLKKIRQHPSQKPLIWAVFIKTTRNHFNGESLGYTLICFISQKNQQSDISLFLWLVKEENIDFLHIAHLLVLGILIFKCLIIHFLGPDGTVQQCYRVLCGPFYKASMILCKEELMFLGAVFQLGSQYVCILKWYLDRKYSHLSLYLLQLSVELYSENQ